MKQTWKRERIYTITILPNQVRCLTERWKSLWLIGILKRFMSTIKRLLSVFCLLILIAGCSAKENNGETAVSPQAASTTKPTSEPGIQTTVEPAKEPEAAPTATKKAGYKTESLFNGVFEYYVKNPLPEHIVIENNEYEDGIEIQVSYERNAGGHELIVTYYIQDNLMGYSSDGAPLER